MEYTALRQKLFPPNFPQPVFFDDFAFALSPKEIIEGDLVIYGEKGVEDVDNGERHYKVCRCKYVEEDTLIVFQDKQLFRVEKERCVRLVFTIPVGLNPHNFLAN